MDRRKPIVREDRDRRDFLETLGKACTRTDWQVHALCWMPKLRAVWGEHTCSTRCCDSAKAMPEG